MTTESAPDAAPRRAERRRGRGLLISGVLCLVLGFGGLGWSAWDLFWNPLVDPGVAAAQASGLREEWAAPAEAARPLPGDAVALLRIPAFGADFEQPVLAGTDQRTLKKGLGWYAGTAAPGEVGNFSVAGHRGATGPFSRMHELKAGDEVVVETREAVHTYRLTNDPAETTVMDTDTWVIQPVPGRPEVKPTEALITLTTCNDLFRSPRRMIAFGVLADTRSK
ncbi:MAG: class E sortase [Propioniciclava sp.]|uniref:class E sortase n=1 Tax=Propioniciclava sp. TaxID=2038686 RepID=UPI0039E493E0